MWYAHSGDVIDLVAYVTTFGRVLTKAREFPVDAGIKGVFFPPEGQFFLGTKELSTPVSFYGSS